MNNRNDGEIKKYLNLIKDLFPYSVGGKLLVGTILGIIVGNKGFMYLSYLALYYYCVNQGVRVPAEELDILDPTISVFSFTFTAISGLIIFLSSFIIIYLSRFSNLTKLFTPNPHSKSLTPILDKIALKLYKSIWIRFFTIVIVCFLITVLILFSSVFKEEVNNTNKLLLFSFIFSFVGYLLILVSFVKSDRGLVPWFGLILLATLSLNSIIFFSNHETIESYLLRTKYGGDYPVEVIKNCHGQKNCENKKDGLLFLRTKKFIYVKDSTSNEIMEIPNDEILSIKYKYM